MAEELEDKRSEIGSKATVTRLNETRAIQIHGVPKKESSKETQFQIETHFTDQIYGGGEIEKMQQSGPWWIVWFKKLEGKIQTLFTLKCGFKFFAEIFDICY